MISLKKFKDNIEEGIKNYPTYWRKGQKVFNFIDENYGVARAVQFEDRIDCFYNDNNIKDFINAAYERYTSL